MTIIYSSKELRPRESRDFYPTPQEFADRAVETVVRAFNREFIANYRLDILDPGCGTGVWGRSIRKSFPNSNITGVDIKFPEDADLGCYNNLLAEDFLNATFYEKFNMAFGNPPYKLAEEFLDKSFEVVMPGGIIAFLYRSAFAESRRRYEKYFNVWKNPKAIYQLVNRISFTGDNKTDNTAYSLFVWEVGYIGSTRFSWLDWKNNGKNNGT